MPSLDRLLEAMERFGANEAFLESGQRPRLMVGDQARTIKGNELSSGQIVGILAEVAPPEIHEELQTGATAQFMYAPPGHPQPVVVDLDRTNGALKVNLQWAAAAPPAPPRAAPPPAPAAAGADMMPDLDLPEPAAGEASPASGADAVQVSSPEPGKHAIDELFMIVVEQNASDLHLSTGNPPFLRLHGEMIPIEGWPAYEADDLLKVLYEITPEKNRKEHEETRDTDFAYPFGDICRFRCNLFMDRKGPAGVFRQIPNEILTPDQIGLPKKVLDLCFLPKGLVVVTGPTGSGKSTTLATMVDHVNQNRKDHIITMEDPIEFVHPNKQCLVHQREVGVHTDSFKKSLRAALREDPDVVLVGEMRDLETRSSPRSA